MINDMICKYLNDFIMMYLNNILMYLKTLKEHKKHIKVIIKALQRQMLSINEKKSVFKSQKVKYLKFVINSDQIEKNSDKTAVI